jgi:two-component system response regulator YesN
MLSGDTMKLMLVDDEKIIREGLLQAVNWSQFGIDMVMQASDGLQAYDLAQDIPPDILLTDIRMPRMDGITLAEKIRKDFPDCQIAFLSSYGDRETYKSAIRLRVAGFIDKPIEWNEFNEVISKAVVLSSGLTNVSPADLDYSISFQKELENKQLQRNSFFLMRLMADRMTIPEAEENLQKMGLSSKSFQFVLCEGSGHPGMPLMLGSKIFDVERELKLLTGAYYIPMLHKNSIVFLGDGSKVCTGEILQELSKSKALESGMHKLYFTASKIVGIDRLAEALRESERILRKRFFLPERRVFDVSEPRHTAYQMDHEMIMAGNQCTIGMDFDRCKEWFASLADSLRRHPDTEPRVAKDLFFTYILKVVNSVYGIECHINHSLEQRTLWSEILGIDNIDDLLAYTYGILDEALLYCNDKNERNLTNKVNTFFAENYQNDINIKMVADMLHFSYSHLCYLYKKETGITMRQQLINIRIEKACELLKSKSMKINDVANSVGYRDPEYFTRVFRNMKGMTPSEYREKF